MSVRREALVTGSAGLHARPAADFAAAAAAFAADIEVAKAGAGAGVDAKSVLLLLTLDVRQGDRISVLADGPDAQEAADTLCRLVSSP